MKLSPTFLLSLLLITISIIFQDWLMPTFLESDFWIYFVVGRYLVCAGVIGIYFIWVKKILEKHIKIWASLREIAFVLIWPLIAGSMLAKFRSPNEYLIDLLAVGIVYIYIPTLILCVGVFITILIVGRIVWKIKRSSKSSFL